MCNRNKYLLPQDLLTAKKGLVNIFNEIVQTYDMLNHILSFGIDFIWRKKFVKMIGHNRVILDVCCGTGDITRRLRSRSRVVSLDFSQDMLVEGKRRGWLSEESLVADAANIPFKNNSFNCITIAFGLRNLPNRNLFYEEALRVLKENGELYILELVLPENILIKTVYQFYLLKVLPIIGGIFSGKYKAYRYLAYSIKEFPASSILQDELIKSGFVDTEVKRLISGGGIILKGSKKGSEP